MVRINYVVACWAGPRRAMHRAFKKDRRAFLKLHIRSLEKLKHELAQITIVVNEFPDPNFDAYVNTLDGKVLGTATVRVIRRPNIGMSYGAWAEAYARDVREHESFSHYIWIEDDYVFVLDHFDREMLAMMRVSGCDYLCGLAAPAFGFGLHAAISNGLVRTEILARVCEKYGTLPHALSDGYRDNELAGQVGVSRAMQEVGGKLSDFVTYGWSVPFSELGNIKKFGDRKGPELMVPAESLLKRK